MFEQWLLYFLASVSLRCVNPCFRALLYIIIAELSLSNDHYQLSWKEDKFLKKVSVQKKLLFGCFLSLHFKGCVLLEISITYLSVICS